MDIDDLQTTREAIERNRQAIVAEMADRRVQQAKTNPFDVEARQAQEYSGADYRGYSDGKRYGLAAGTLGTNFKPSAHNEMDQISLDNDRWYRGMADPFAHAQAREMMPNIRSPYGALPGPNAFQQRGDQRSAEMADMLKSLN